MDAIGHIAAIELNNFVSLRIKAACPNEGEILIHDQFVDHDNAGTCPVPVFLIFLNASYPVFVFRLNIVVIPVKTCTAERLECLSVEIDSAPALGSGSLADPGRTIVVIP